MKIFKKAFLLIFIILLCTAGVYAENDGYKIGMVTATSLNIRQQASVDADIVGSVTQGEAVKICWLEPDWVRVTYNDIDGYVSRDYLNIELKQAETGINPPLSEIGAKAAELAKTFLGTPYVYGGSTPDGFDCSGLVHYIYEQLGVTIDRVADDQMKNGEAVSSENLQPGDIVGFYSGEDYIGHVGIYVGDGLMIHSPQTGDVVKYEHIDLGNYSLRLAGGRRIY